MMEMVGEYRLYALAGLIAFCLSAVLWVVLGSLTKGKDAQKERFQKIRNSGPKDGAAADLLITKTRRRDVEAVVKKLENDQKNADKAAKKLTLDTIIEQAGMAISIKQFYIGSAGAGVVLFVLGYFLEFGFPVAAGFGFVGALGLPRFLINKKRTKRLEKFRAELPTAMDIIVRGIKAGLPLNDCLHLVATECAEPLKSEFQKIIDRQAAGVPLSQAIPELYRRIPISEVNFFAIVIAIQQQAGGNLSEALGNLSGVLRARKAMKGKIASMTQEVKVSTYIIGAMPLVIVALTYVSSPDYIMVLFTTDTGHLILGVAGTWMGIGLFVMKKMTKFEI